MRLRNLLARAGELTLAPARRQTACAAPQARVRRGQRPPPPAPPPRLAAAQALAVSPLPWAGRRYGCRVARRGQTVLGHPVAKAPNGCRRPRGVGARSQAASPAARREVLVPRLSTYNGARRAGGARSAPAILGAWRSNCRAPWPCAGHAAGPPARAAAVPCTGARRTPVASPRAGGQRHFTCAHAAWRRAAVGLNSMGTRRVRVPPQPHTWSRPRRGPRALQRCTRQFWSLSRRFEARAAAAGQQEQLQQQQQ